MERGESSNIENKYTRRARTSGIVIREGVAAPAPAPVPTAVVDANILAGEGNQAQQAAPFIREVDQYMPIASIARIMRRVLPEHARITNDAKEAIQKCVSQFINFITAEANGRCNQDYRSTITPEDVLTAMASLGFDEYLEPLTVFLENHRANDPERGSTSQPQFVQRVHEGFTHQPQAVQMVQPPPPLPPPVAAMPAVGYYTPLPPDAAATTENEGGLGGFTQPIDEYIVGNHDGGEGSSGGWEFDPFLRSFK